ncbi:MAG: FliG C-terminal domain-containing protein [Sphingomonadales bacterium]
MADYSLASKVDGDAAAAILLTLLGDNEAASILSSLNPDEAHRIGVAMMNVASATTADIEAALEMFVERSKAMTGLGLDAAPRVRSVFTAALGPVRAETLLTDIAPQQSLGVLEKLRWMKVEAISATLDAEQPQVGALLLACLTPEIAAAALAPLSEDRQSDLIYRAASLGHVSAHALRDLEDLLDAYVPAESGGPGIKLGGRGDAAKIVTKMAKGTDQRVLKALKKRDKALAQDIEDDMFVFDDLSALDTKNMGTLMRSVDTAVLTLALRGASPETVDKMVGCLSVRAAQTIRDEMAESAPAKRADVEAAQKEIAGTARRMAESGDLNLGGSKANDDYV